MKKRKHGIKQRRRRRRKESKRKKERQNENTRKLMICERLEEQIFNHKKFEVNLLNINLLCSHIRRLAFSALQFGDDPPTPLSLSLYFVYSSLSFALTHPPFKLYLIVVIYACVSCDVFYAKKIFYFSLHNSITFRQLYL